MKEDHSLCFCYLLIALFAGSILWINFHSAFWYDMDMALNSSIAKLMWEEKTFFPENWIFGNSYFIIETPNLAALFYGLTHQTTLAMSLASSFWMLLILATFFWSLKPFISRKGMAAGLLCLIGGIIFGTSAAAYTKGLQVLYTMASYYACYLEVVLLTMGVWIRIVDGRKIHWALWGLAIVLNFAVGMHSLREMLTLGLPLLALSLLTILPERGRKNIPRHLAAVFSFLVLLAEAAGYLTIRCFDIPTSPNIGTSGMDLSLAVLSGNFINSTKNILRISGIALIKDGVQYLPLAICALGVAACVLWAAIEIIKKKDASALSFFILFSWISILAVFAVGVVFFKTRDIYFFLYWLLATLSIVYLGVHNERKRRWLSPLLCLVAIVNFCYSFIPDFIDYHRYSPQMKETAQRLADAGYTTLYGDDCAVFAAASKDRIVATPIRLDFGSDRETSLNIFPYNKDISLYDESHERHAFICLSDYYLKQISEERLDENFVEWNKMGPFRWRDREILLYLPAEGKTLHVNR